ncbi:hypothetical protein CDV31_004501 [Fusarium ambrosium]|uniref:Uncharacterized protein n=1 Tax=Fusarium ambrosium TaxID=131363 RepID=A0A428UR30_9HYPO|nr:hypothetical protein CDV31_004501 [Fusarium ambrosium]
MVKRDKKVDLVWSATPGTLSDKVADAIRRAWPRNRNVKGMVDLLLDSDGTMPFSKVSWQHFETSVNESIWHRWCLDAAESVRRKHNKSSPDHADTTSPPSRFRGKIIYCQLENYKKEQHMFPLDQLASALSYDEPFHLPPSKRGLGKSCDDFDFDHLLSFLDRDFQGGLDNQGFAGYQFQLRYFCPIDELRARERPVRYPCFLGHRQRAIIGRGSAIQYLEEKRARVSLRVSPFFPGLFNIFILADHNMLPIREEWTPNPTGEHTEFNWARYGLKPCGMGTFFTHFMFEVSRVLDRSLDAWGETLDSIDKLVHVNLDDFEDEKRVEDLMFDKSFTRSKDYFVAIQLLRITDEWLDEVLQTIDGLRNMPALYRRLFCIDAAEDNINAAIKGMKERTTRLQSRIRKKAEEIKSLRDGLFNATSLREATKAMALNQAIYVFTVVTVLFTPVSLLATFWALPFLNNPAEEGSEMVPEPSSFRSSFVTLPLLTYALVVGIAWYMRPDQSRYRLSDWLTGILDTTRERLNSAWNGFPREMKRTRRRGQGGPDAGDSA